MINLDLCIARGMDIRVYWSFALTCSARVFGPLPHRLPLDLLLLPLWGLPPALAVRRRLGLLGGDDGAHAAPEHAALGSIHENGHVLLHDDRRRTYKTTVTTQLEHKHDTVNSLSPVHTWPKVKTHSDNIRRQAWQAAIGDKEVYFHEMEARTG